MIPFYFSFELNTVSSFKNLQCNTSPARLVLRDLDLTLPVYSPVIVIILAGVSGSGLYCGIFGGLVVTPVLGLFLYTVIAKHKVSPGYEVRFGRVSQNEQKTDL